MMSDDDDEKLWFVFVFTGCWEKKGRSRKGRRNKCLIKKEEFWSGKKKMLINKFYFIFIDHDEKYKMEKKKREMSKANRADFFMLINGDINKCFFSLLFFCNRMVYK